MWGWRKRLPIGVEVVQTSPGYSAKVQIGQQLGMPRFRYYMLGEQWQVVRNGRPIGIAERHRRYRPDLPLTKHTSLPQWSSPGWFWQETGGTYWVEQPRLVDCVRAIIRNADVRAKS